MSTAARIPTALTSTMAATTLRAAATKSTSTTTSLAAASISRPIAQTSILPITPRTLHTTPSPLRAPEPSDNPGAMPDGLAERPAKGTTGGGEKLDSSARNSAPQPKISNLSVPGGGQDKLTEQQRKEVEQHNKEFEEKHDRGHEAADDKVDKKFWSSERGKE